MDYVIFAFRSRTQAMRFHEELRRAGLGPAMISTPREVSVGCGLSVRLDAATYGSALAVLERSRSVYNTFLGVFSVGEHDGTRRVERIYF